MDGSRRETPAHWGLLRLLNNATDSTNREPELQPRKYGLVEPFLDSCREINIVRHTIKLPSLTRFLFSNTNQQTRRIADLEILLTVPKPHAELFV